MNPESPSRQAKTILLTGATGLLGSSLLIELLDQGHRVVAVARARAGLGARQRLERILAALSPFAPGTLTERLEVLEVRSLGDLNRRRTLEPVDAVIHAAAAVKFNSTSRELDQQNVGGTRALLEALGRLSPSAPFHFVSTAYVWGRRAGRAREQSGLSTDVAFRHEYEKSKTRAENLVTRHCLDQGRAFSIYRPSIIAGSAADGAAANFNGIYALLRALEALSRLLPPNSSPRQGPFIPCNPAGTKNIVPVDWVASVIARLTAGGASNRVYHLTHPAPLTHEEILGIVREITGLGSLAIWPSTEDEIPQNRFQKWVDRSLSHFSPYLWEEPEFERDNLENALGESAEPPAVDREYFRRILTFARQARWGEFPLEESPVHQGTVH